MAHRSNVIQVHQNFDPSRQSGDAPEMVTDPVCGKKLERKSARHVLFRESGTYYFCSKDCQQTFLSPTFGKKKTAA